MAAELTFLHVGCGPSRKAHAGPGFQPDHWREIRLDIDPSVEPDIVGTMLDMGGVPDASVDAVYSAHNIEHLYAHEVPRALSEFRRVLKPQGFVVITCPDLQAVARLVANGQLTDAAYVSPMGPVSPMDIIFGYGPALAAGNSHMAHRCGFTLDVLLASLRTAGFAGVAGVARAQGLDLWALATREALPEAALRQLAATHLPLTRSATP